MNKKTFRIIGIVCLITGMFLLVFLGIISISGEVEATFFNAGLKSDEPLSTLHCPAVITNNEVGIVSGNFYNPSDKIINMEVRTYVTDGYVTLMDEIIINFILGPGENKIVEVPVTAEDAAYNRIVMVRMHQMKRIPLPYQNAACGIVVVNLPFLTGMQFIILTIGLGVLLSAGGITLWAVNAKPIVWDRLRNFQAMIFLTVTAIASTVTSLLNLWALALIITIVWLLMGLSMIWQFSTSPRKKVVTNHKIPE